MGTDPCVELGDTRMAFEEFVLGTQSSGTSAPTLQRAGECCSSDSATHHSTGGHYPSTSR